MFLTLLTRGSFLHAEASSHEPHQINWCEFVKFVSQKRLRKTSIQMITFIALFRLIAMEAKEPKQKGITMNSLTQFKKIRLTKASKKILGNFGCAFL